jgi:NAD(P)-dependent dehydrogenase (short-subunit alcohol dehydrogenase family)
VRQEIHLPNAASQSGGVAAPDQKTAIVTGASRGIGAAIAERLARYGFTVVINYAGSAAPAEALAAKIEKAGGKAIAAQADVSDPAAVERMFDSAAPVLTKGSSLAAARKLRPHIIGALQLRMPRRLEQPGFREME